MQRGEMPGTTFPLLNDSTEISILVVANYTSHTIAQSL